MRAVLPETQKRDNAFSSGNHQNGCRIVSDVNTAVGVPNERPDIGSEIFQTAS